MGELLAWTPIPGRGRSWQGTRQDSQPLLAGHLRHHSPHTCPLWEPLLGFNGKCPTPAQKQTVLSPGLEAILQSLPVSPGQGLHSPSCPYPRTLTRQSHWPVQHFGYPCGGLTLIHTHGSTAWWDLLPEWCKDKMGGSEQSTPAAPRGSRAPQGTLT